MENLSKLKILRLLGLLLIPSLMILISCEGGGKGGIGVGYYKNNYGYGYGSGGPIISSLGGQVDGGGFNTFGRNNYFDNGICIPRGQSFGGQYGQQYAQPYSAGGTFGGFRGQGIGTLNQGFGRGLGTGSIRPPFIAANGHSIYKQSDLANAIMSEEHYQGAQYLQQAMDNFYAQKFPIGYQYVMKAEQANPNDSIFMGHIDDFKSSTHDMATSNQDKIAQYEQQQHAGVYHESPDPQLIFDDINEFGESMGNAMSWLIFNGVHNITHGLTSRARSFEAQQQLHRVDPYIKSLREAEEYSRLNAFGYSSWDDYYGSQYGRITPPNC